MRDKLAALLYRQNSTSAEEVAFEDLDSIEEGAREPWLRDADEVLDLLGVEADRPLKVGDVVPMPLRKLDVRPAFTGSGAPTFKPARHGARPPGK